MKITGIVPMNNFIKINWFYAQTATAETLNGFFYYLRKLPLIGKKIPATIYKSQAIKLILMILTAISQIVIEAILKILLVGVAFFCVLAVTAIRHGESISINMIEVSTPKQAIVALLLVVLVTILIPRIMNLFYRNPDKDILKFIAHFQLSYAKTMKTLAIFKELKKTFFYIIPTFVIGWLSDVGALKLAVLCMVLRLFFFVLFEMISRKVMLDKMKAVPRFILWAVFELLVIAGFVVICKCDFANVIASLPVMLALTLGIVILGFGFLTFKGESRYIENLINAGNVSIAKSKEVFKNSKHAYLADGLNMKKQMSLEGEHHFDNLKGSNLLNSLLFFRYRKTLRTGIIIRIAFFGFVLFGAIVVELFIIYNHQQGELSFSEDTVLQLLPAFVFLMYFIGYGKKIVQMCFVNCDIAMLHYPVYRESKNILSGFNQRFKKAFELNSIIVLCIFANVLLMCIFWGTDISLKCYIVLFFFLIAVNLLFSFHELFIYYLLQPFTSDMNVVSPLYKMITWVFYGFCYMTSQLKIKGYGFVLGISIVSLLYVGIGYMVIKKKAPTTFRIKA
jgi:hypothetical protein